MFTVEELLIERRHGVTWYCARVRCDCGTVKVVYQKQLLNGRTLSCGCFKNRNLLLARIAVQKPIEANGRSQSMYAWARELGVSPQVIWQRINTQGWDPARAATTPLRQDPLVEVNGERLTIAEWSKRYGVSARVIWNRLRKGWKPAEAVTTPVRAWGSRAV
jgi:lambda repressor-like predicted transcriptional regulator